MKGSETIKVTLYKADGVLYPVAGRKDKVVIVLSGSEGGLEHAEKLAKCLQEHGIPALALGYFKTKHSVKTLNKIEAPILMFSTEVDTIWPSKESCEKMEERLNVNHFSYPHKHICFEHMSHMMLENCGKSIKWFMKSEKQFPEECARERAVMGQECIEWIEKVW